MSLFNACYGGEEGGEENQQSGCGLAAIGAMDPLVETLKKSLLSASEAVIKRLKKRQVGRGRQVKKRKQVGSGRKRVIRKKQRGSGRKQTGAGRKQKGSGRRQTGAGRRQKGAGQKQKTAGRKRK
jgi:hypothetical protein